MDSIKDGERPEDIMDHVMSLHAEAVAEVDAIFEFADTDGSGEITIPELYAAVEGMSEEDSNEAVLMFVKSDEMDGETDNAVSKDDVVDRIMWSHAEDFAEEFTDFVFAEADVGEDSEGFLTGDEVTDALERALEAGLFNSKEEIEEAFDLVFEGDENGDGLVSWEEFYNGTLAELSKIEIGGDCDGEAADDTTTE